PELRAVAAYRHHELREVSRGNRDVPQAGVLQLLEEYLDDGSVAERHQRFRKHRGQGTQAGTFTPGEDHRLRVRELVCRHDSAPCPLHHVEVALERLEILPDEL